MEAVNRKRSRNKLRVYVHFCWATRERLPLVTEDIARDVCRCIAKVCQDDGCDVLAVNAMPDHVHLFAALNGVNGFSDLMKHAKGGSSRLITQKLKPGEWFAWQKNYAAFGVSISHRKRVTEYVLNQQQHHADGTLWPEAEETEEWEDLP